MLKNTEEEVLKYVHVSGVGSSDGALLCFAPFSPFKYVKNK